MRSLDMLERFLQHSDVMHKRITSITPLTDKSFEVIVGSKKWYACVESPSIDLSAYEKVYVGLTCKQEQVCIRIVEECLHVRPDTRIIVFNQEGHKATHIVVQHLAYSDIRATVHALFSHNC